MTRSKVVKQDYSHEPECRSPIRRELWVTQPAGSETGAPTKVMATIDHRFSEVFLTREPLCSSAPLWFMAGGQGLRTKAASQEPECRSPIRRELWVNQLAGSETGVPTEVMATIHVRFAEVFPFHEPQRRAGVLPAPVGAAGGPALANALAGQATLALRTSVVQTAVDEEQYIENRSFQRIA